MKLLAELLSHYYYLNSLKLGEKSFHIQGGILS